jgi:hypothetical protein
MKILVPGRALGLPVENVGIAWGAAAILLVSYLSTMARDLGIWDSGILALVAIQGGVGHPPGAPLHTWLGFLLSHIPGLPPLVGVGLVSVIPGALLPIPVLSLCASLHGAAVSSERRFDGLLPALVLVALCVHPSVWDPATRVEVYSLAAFLGVWGVARLSESLNQVRRTDDACPVGLGLAGLSLGLSAACNPVVATILALPALTALVLAIVRRRLPIRQLGRLVMGGTLGLFPYLGMLVLARNPNVVAWGRPTDASSLWRHLRAADFDRNVGVELSTIIDHARDWLGFSMVNGLILWIAAGVVGWVLLGKNMSLGRGYGPVSVLLAVLAIAANAVWFPENPDYLGYLAGPVVVCAAGAAALVGQFSGRSKMAHGLVVVFSCTCLVVAVLSPPGLFHRTRHRDHVARVLAEGALAEAPANTILIVESDHWLWPLLYLQEIEHQRPDVVLLPMGLSSSTWYWQHLYHRHPDLRPFAIAGAGARVGRIQRFVAAQTLRPIHFESQATAMLMGRHSEDVGFLSIERIGSPDHATAVTAALASSGSVVDSGSLDAIGVLALVAFQRGEELWRTGRSAEAYAAFFAGIPAHLRDGLPLSIEASARVTPPKQALRPPMSLRGLGDPASNLAAVKEMLRRLQP